VNRVKSKPVVSVPAKGGMASSVAVIKEYGESLQRLSNVNNVQVLASIVGTHHRK
jgi:hypothetical protein